MHPDSRPFTGAASHVPGDPRFRGLAGDDPYGYRLGIQVMTGARFWGGRGDVEQIYLQLLG